MPFSVENWLEAIGLDMNLKTLLIISAAASMHSPITQAASENLLANSVKNSPTLKMEQSKMSATRPKHYMTDEEQAPLLLAMKTGLRWAAGEITFEDVQRTF